MCQTWIYVLIEKFYNFFMNELTIYTTLVVYTHPVAARSLANSPFFNI